MTTSDHSGLMLPVQSHLQLICGNLLTSESRFSNLDTRASGCFLGVLLRLGRNKKLGFVESIATELQVEMASGFLERYSLLHALAGKGFRLTSQRRALIETIQEAEGHLDAATLLKAARQRDPRIDRATVYRMLDLLKKLRLVDELDLMHLNGEKHYYEAKTRRDHMHLACLECGKIEEFTSPVFERLKQEIAQQNGFDIRVIRLEVGGRCRACCGALGEVSRQQEVRRKVAGTN